MAQRETEDVQVSVGFAKVNTDEKTSILKRISIFTTSNVISNFISMITSVAIARIMSPAIYGEWQIFKIFLQYSNYSNLGINTVMSRRLPQFKENEVYIQKLYDVRNAAYSFNIVSTVVGTIIILVILIFKTKFNPLIILSMIFVLIIQLLYNFRYANLVAQQSLEHAAKLAFVLSLAGFLFILPLTYFYKLQGAILGQLAVYFVAFSLVCRLDTYIYSFLFDFRTLSSLLREGSLFCLHGLLATFGLGHERLFLVYLHGTKALGTYGLAILTIGIFQGIASNFFQGFFPFLSGKISSESLENSESLAREGLKFFSMAILVLGIIAATFLGPMTKLLLPKYLGGLWAAFIVIGAMLFIPIRFLGVYYQASQDRIYRPILVYVVVLAIILLPNYILIRDYGVIGAAIAETIAQITITISFLSTIFWNNKNDAIKILLKSVALFPIILLIGWVNIHYNLWVIPFGLFILLLLIVASGATFKEFAHQLLKIRS